jgi:hypothetical protein
MNKRTWIEIAAAGFVAAIAIPSIAIGNARTNPATATNTPYVAALNGPNELTATTTTADPDGLGAAAVTFDLGATPPNVCWDLSYSGIEQPVAAHIHSAPAGVDGPVVIPFTTATLGPTSATGCANLATAAEQTAAAGVVANPANFYVNIHTATYPAGAIRGQLSAGPQPAGEAHMLAVPLRSYDSRDGGGAKIAPNETRTINLTTGKDATGASLIAVPPGAKAALVTLTVTETVAPGGFLKLYSAAISTPPATSSVNWAGTNQNVAVSTQVAVDSSSQVKVTGGVNPTHFVIDVVGYLF